MAWQLDELAKLARVDSDDGAAAATLAALDNEREAIAKILEDEAQKSEVLMNENAAKHRYADAAIDHTCMATERFWSREFSARKGKPAGA